MIINFEIKIKNLFMNLEKLLSLIESIKDGNRTLLSVNFGCRVNSAELNQLSQILINFGFSPSTIDDRPSIILINTCSITQKGEFESLQKVRHLHDQYPDAIVLVTGCANPTRISKLKNVYFFDNKIKETIIDKFDTDYSPKIGDKFSHTHRYLLRVQSGCTQFCSFCTVPYRRLYLWSLPIEKAVNTVNKAIANGYKEIIITGVNLDQYQFGFSNLVEALLTKTEIPLISFGSIPVNCIDNKFITLVSSFQNRVSSFLHIPIQSGSDKILKLMNRPYNKEKIIQVFKNLKLKIKNCPLGTDIIVGFPSETDDDFQQTYDLCQSIGFSKIHTFRYSPRDNTLAKIYSKKYPKLPQKIINDRSHIVRSLPASS